MAAGESYKYCVAGTEIGDEEKALGWSNSNGILRMYITSTFGSF